MARAWLPPSNRACRSHRLNRPASTIRPPVSSTAETGPDRRRGPFRRTRRLGSTSLRPERADTAGASHIVFVVRDDDGESDLLFQTSDTTWQAYNRLRRKQPVRRATGRAGFQGQLQPAVQARDDDPYTWLFSAEYPMLRWLEANGYDVSYFTGSTPIVAVPRSWSTRCSSRWDTTSTGPASSARKWKRLATPACNLAFFSGNEVFWKTRWETSIDGCHTPFRTMVSYKETHGEREDRPESVVDRDLARSAFQPAVRRRAARECADRHHLYRQRTAHRRDLVPAADGKMRFWRNTRIARLHRAVGDAPGRPLGLRMGRRSRQRLPAGRPDAAVVDHVQRPDEYLLDYGSSTTAGTATHHLTLYRAASGALVFGAGTIQWSWGLDSPRRLGGPRRTMRMQQATVNLFADMGVQPATLQVGPHWPRVDRHDAADLDDHISDERRCLQRGEPVTISGTAADTGGGVVGGVEVSTDGGATWHPATRRETWTYAWTRAAPVRVTIRAAPPTTAANIQNAGPGRSRVEIGAALARSGRRRQRPDRLGSDLDAVELGVRFQSDGRPATSPACASTRAPAIPGRTSGTCGPRAASCSPAPPSPTRRATGWQQVTFATPVAITANTTYVASYFAPNGHYSLNAGLLRRRASTNAPLTRARDGDGGGNGVYRTAPQRLPEQHATRRATTGSTSSSSSTGQRDTHAAARCRADADVGRDRRRGRRRGHGALQRGGGRCIDERRAASSCATTSVALVPTVGYDGDSRHADPDARAPLRPGRATRPRSPAARRASGPGTGMRLRPTTAWSFSTRRAGGLPCSLWSDVRRAERRPRVADGGASSSA